MTAQVRVWALRVASLFVLLAGLAAIGVGVLWATWPPPEPGEIDDVALLFGILIGLVGLVVVFVALVVLFLARRRTVAAAVVLCVFGVLAALLGWSTVDAFGIYLSAPLLLGGLAVGGVGFGVCLGARGVTIDSRSGISR